MRIKCKKILTSTKERKDRGLKSHCLTVRNEYIVLAIYIKAGIISYQLEDDSNSFTVFEADQFEVLSNYIPSNWEINFYLYESGAYYMDLTPKAWNNMELDENLDRSTSFYEDIIDIPTPLEQWRNNPDAPKIMKLYFQERDKIYREEEYQRSQLRNKK